MNYFFEKILYFIADLYICLVYFFFPKKFDKNSELIGTFISDGVDLGIYESICHLLTNKYGSVPKNIKKQLKKTSRETLLEIMTRTLDVNTLEQALLPIRHNLDEKSG